MKEKLEFISQGENFANLNSTPDFQMKGVHIYEHVFMSGNFQVSSKIITCKFATISRISVGMKKVRILSNSQQEPRRNGCRMEFKNVCSLQSPIVIASGPARKPRTDLKKKEGEGGGKWKEEKLKYYFYRDLSLTLFIYTREIVTICHNKFS